ncbi:MAG: hypothetical protein DHS20C15_11780 [Planctomycetota bacterium]|nr:MAG: hypothetical protein DHS20C15_11780 [Planctomycetota bacterium]
MDRDAALLVQYHRSRSGDGVAAKLVRRIQDASKFSETSSTQHPLSTQFQRVFHRRVTVTNKEPQLHEPRFADQLAQPKLVRDL